MSGRKRLAYGTEKIGAVPAELPKSVKQSRKNHPYQSRHEFYNGARFEWLLRFAAGYFRLADHSGVDTIFVNTSAFLVTNPHPDLNF